MYILDDVAFVQVIWIKNDGRIARRSYINPQRRKRRNDGMSGRSWYPSEHFCELSSLSSLPISRSNKYSL